MELDNAIATPLYKQLEELILDKITSGTLTPGSKLPTENELTKRASSSPFKNELNEYDL